MECSIPAQPVHEQLAGSVMDLRQLIDPRYPASQSVVLRYHALNSLGLTPEELERSSIREGLRIVPLLEYRGVEICVLDAVSLTATNTFKSIDGCVVSALAHRAGIRRCAVASGGNTGIARALYAQRLGIETFWFLPAENEGLVPQAIRNNPGIHLFLIDDPGKVKLACNELIARHPDVHAIPTEWKVAAFEALGGFIAEQSLQGAGFDWVAQTVSAGFAPLAYCRVLRRLAGLGLLPEVPRFLGVQQQENCHMYKAWTSNRQQEPISSTSELLLPVIFDTEPHTYNTQQEFFRLLDEHHGLLNTVSREEFGLFEDELVRSEDLVRRLAAQGVHVREQDGKILQKAGFVALCGVVKAIDAGAIPAGNRVLSILSG